MNHVNNGYTKYKLYLLLNIDNYYYLYTVSHYSNLLMYPFERMLRG